MKGVLLRQSDDSDPYLTMRAPIQQLEAEYIGGMAMLCDSKWHATSEELTGLLLLIILQRIMCSSVGVLWLSKPCWILFLAFKCHFKSRSLKSQTHLIILEDILSA